MEIEFESEYQLEIKNQFYDSLDGILRHLLDVSVKSHDIFKKEIVTCIDKIFVYPFSYPILKTESKKRVYRHIFLRKLSFNLLCQ